MALEDVKNCCRCLDSDGILKRRKAAEQLSHLLNNSAIVSALSVSSRQNNAGFNWDQVFYASKNFFLKESEKLEKDERLKANASLSLRGTWANHKRTSAALPKMIIKKSTLDNCPVSLRHILDFVFLILDKSHPYLLENHAGVALQIIQSYIMNSPHYYLSITQDKWKDLLRICIWIYEKNVAHADPVTILGVMEGIFKYFKLCGTISPHRISPSAGLKSFPAFFLRATNSASLTYGTQEALISLIFTVCSEYGSQWRYALCKLGEDTMPFFLGLWEDQETPRQLLLVKYLNLQLMMHHPQEDGIFLEKSKYSHNDQLWEKLLKQLYISIHDFLTRHSQNARLGAFSSSNGVHSISDDFLDLSARLFSKIFDEYGDVSTFDVTQLRGNGRMSPSCSSNPHAQSNKKRRVEIGFQSICELLIHEGTEWGTIPWYQILSRMLTNHSYSFTEERCQNLLDVLTQILSQTKDAAVLDEVVRCLSPLAFRFVSLHKSKLPHPLTARWSAVWDSIVRLIGGRQCIEASLLLLKRLLEYNCVKVDGKLYSLFYRGVINVDLNGLELLETLIKAHPIPKRIKDDLNLAADAEEVTPAGCLLKILLSLSNDLDVASRCTAIEHPKQLACVLSLLRLDNPAKSHKIRNIKAETKLSSSSCSLEAEEFFLKSTFTASPRPKHPESQTDQKLRVNPEIEKEIVNRVALFAQQKLNEGPNISKDMLELALNLLEVLMHLSFSFDDPRLFALFDKHSLISRIFQDIMAENESSRYRSLLPPLKHLVEIYKLALQLIKSDPSKNEIVKELLKRTSSQLQEVACKIIDSCVNALPPTNQSQIPLVSQINFNARNSSVYHDSNDNFDPDFDDMDSPSAHVEFDDFEESDKNEINEESEKASKLTFSQHVFTVRDRCSLVAAHWLGCIYELNLLVGQEQDEDESPFVKAAEEFLSLSERAEINDCSLVFSFVDFLFSMTYLEININDGILLLSNIAKKHSKDARVAYCILQSIKVLLVNNGTHLIQQQKLNLLHMVKLFAKKYSEGSYGINVARALFEINLKFTELDPLRSWSTYEVENDHRSCEFYSLLRNPYHELRMLAAEHLGLLFTTKDGQLMPLDHQKEKFQHVYQIAIESLNVEQGNAFGDFLFDEGNSHVTSFLSALAYVALSSPFLESKAIFALFSAPKVHKIDKDLIKNALQSISTDRGSKLQVSLKEHILFILCQWIHDDHSFDDFPFSILECESSSTFYESYSDMIVIGLFQEDRLDGIETLALQLETNLVELLRKNLSDLMALVIPYVVVAVTNPEGYRNLPKTKTAAATKKFKYLQSKLGDEFMSNHLNDNIGQIVLKMLNMSHDSAPWRDLEIIVPPPHYYFDSTLLSFALENVHNVFYKGDEPLIVRMARQKGSLHLVLHGLLSALDASSSQHHFRWSISKLETLLVVLLPYIGRGLERMNAYVVRKLVHILCCYTKRIYHVDKLFAKKMIKLLENFLLATLEDFPNHLQTSLYTLIHRLLDFIHDCPDLREAASRILAKILSSEDEQIQKTLASFPFIFCYEKISCLTELKDLHSRLVLKFNRNLCLRTEILHFVNIPAGVLTSNHLNYVFRQLKEKKTELPELMEPSNESGQKLIHLLIHKIVSVISTTEDSEKNILGLKCLGELGPVDLNTEVFVLEEVPHKELLLISEISYIPYAHILLLLNKMTLFTDVKLVEVASNTLKDVLCSKVGLQTVKVLGDSFQEEVYPFVPLNKRPSSLDKYKNLDEETFSRVILNENIWDSRDEFGKWITTLTPILIKCGCNCNFIHSLDELCGISVSFCEEVLPYIFHRVLEVDARARRNALSKMISFCIDKNMKLLHSESVSRSEESDKVHECKKTIKLILKVINYLRQQDPGICFSQRKKLTNWERILWLNLDYLQLAKAAFTCGQYFSALLYVEFACELMNEDQQVSLGDTAEAQLQLRLQRRQLPPLQRISDSQRGRDACELMFKIYDALEDKEGVEGCSYVGRASNYGVQAILSQHRSHWLHALSISDAEQCSNNLIDVLQKMGMFNLLRSVVSSSGSSNEKIIEAQAESAWRLGQWDEVTDQGLKDIVCSQKNEFGFNSCFLNSLVAFKNKDLTGVRDALQDAQKGVLHILKENRNESSNRIYPLLSNMKIISDFEELSTSVVFDDGSFGDCQVVADLESFWMKGDSSLPLQNEHLETVLSARISTVKVLSSLFKDRYTESLLFRLLVKKCQLARCLQSPTISQCKSALLDAEKLSLSLEESWQFKVEEALLLKALNNDHQAVNSLKQLLEEAQPQEVSDRKQLQEMCRAFSLCGKLLMDSRTMSPKLIMENYLVKAVNLLEEKFDDKHCPLLPETYNQLAFFCDKLYEEIRTLRGSEQIKNRVEQLKKGELELNNLLIINKNSRLQGAELKEMTKKCVMLKKDTQKESAVLKKYEQEEEFYLKLALSNYLKCLKTSSDYSLTIFRVVALWFENLKVEYANECMKQYGSQLKSHQFLPLLYQLVARLTLQENSSKHHYSFPSTLTLILERICMDHPHHALPVVLMLANSYMDQKFQDPSPSGAKKSMNRRSSLSCVTEDRVEAAKNFVSRLKGSFLANHLAELETVCEAYIQLAYVPGDRRPNKEMSMENQKLTKLRHIKYTSPLVNPIAVQPSAIYSPPLIVRWLPKFTSVGGINCPKRLTVIMSDGKELKELLKGNDDLRQDAVLEQVFNVVNELLKKDPEAKKKKLSLRTYMVTPLSQKCGLIQWCNNTIALREYLSGAHSRYYPEQLREMECAEKFKKAASKSGPTTLLSSLQEILDCHHPVLRFFFFEKYPRPEQWFTHRRLYARSVAVSSITGFVFGIGDRHNNNILIESTTAELIHIDLGIAFEAGHLLPTPETVPFRLTQNIIDGLGPTGTEGSLRKSMETTLSVLREAKSVLITIVDVLRHDPLHQWSLTPEQVSRLQEVNNAFVADDSSRSMAERALLRVQQKLNGLQDGLVLSVPEHVSLLIQQATDLNNLCRLFYGWAPYL